MQGTETKSNDFREKSPFERKRDGSQRWGSGRWLESLARKPAQTEGCWVAWSPSWSHWSRLQLLPLLSNGCGLQHRGLKGSVQPANTATGDTDASSSKVPVSLYVCELSRSVVSHSV